MTHGIAAWISNEEKEKKLICPKCGVDDISCETTDNGAKCKCNQCDWQKTYFRKFEFLDWS